MWTICQALAAMHCAICVSRGRQGWMQLVLASLLFCLAPKLYCTGAIWQFAGLLWGRLDSSRLGVAPGPPSLVHKKAIVLNVPFRNRFQLYKVCVWAWEKWNSTLSMQMLRHGKWSWMKASLKPTKCHFHKWPLFEKNPLCQTRPWRRQTLHWVCECLMTTSEQAHPTLVSLATPYFAQLLKQQLTIPLLVGMLKIHWRASKKETV